MVVFLPDLNQVPIGKTHQVFDHSSSGLSMKAKRIKASGLEATAVEVGQQRRDVPEVSEIENWGFVYYILCIYIYMYVCMSVCICVDIYIYMYMCICVCIYIYTRLEMIGTFQKD